RLRLESYNRPISCGGVLVFPGDVIVAAGEGVIVVPRERALEVGQYADGIRTGDGKGRLERYKKLNLPVDDTVKKYKDK
ncbi:RraA family protein, partial [bacterium]|nr:RraA family protein [bacterium]